MPTPASDFEGFPCSASPSSHAAAGPSAATITPRAAVITVPPPSNFTSAGPLPSAALTDAAGVPVHVPWGVRQIYVNPGGELLTIPSTTVRGSTQTQGTQLIYDNEGYNTILLPELMPGCAWLMTTRQRSLGTDGDRCGTPGYSRSCRGSIEP